MKRSCFEEGADVAAASGTPGPGATVCETDSLVASFEEEGVECILADVGLVIC